MPYHGFQESHLVDLLELDMTDLDVILGMNLIYFGYNSVLYRNEVVQF